MFHLIVNFVSRKLSEDLLKYRKILDVIMLN